MATIKEVAERAKVSVGTVSNVLSGATSVNPRLRRRVLAAVRELDYTPNHVARSLKTKQTKMLGFVVPDITNPFFPVVARGAEDVASKGNYLLVIVNTDDKVERERQVLSILRSRRVDGILLAMAPNDGDVTHLMRTVEAGIPIVCLDRIPCGIALDSVSVDNALGARECVRHLVSMGHREIAIICGPAELEPAKERLRGYKEALREAKIRVNHALIREGDFRIESGYREAHALLRAAKPPTALFVSNGVMTLGVLGALDELRIRCPEDIALASFDDLPLAASFRPRLTAVAQDAYQIGQSGATLLLDRIKGKINDPNPVEVRLRTELRIRESSLTRIPRVTTAKKR
jgi:LacI family transcriptional regulator